MEQPNAPENLRRDVPDYVLSGRRRAGGYSFWAVLRLSRRFYSLCRFITSAEAVFVASKAKLLERGGPAHKLRAAALCIGHVRPSPLNHGKRSQLDSWKTTPVLRRRFWIF